MFAVLGEALLDMVQPRPGDTYRALPAGGPLNIAVGLRRLGHPTAMMARFSSSALGARIRQFAVASDLDLSASVTADQQPTLAFATVDAGGRASYDFFVRETADWGWTEVELAAVPEAALALHTGSLATALEPGAVRILAWWESHAGAGRLLSFDPNVRPGLAGPRQTAVRRVERFVASSNLVKASDEDLAWLYPDIDPMVAVRRWAALGPSLAVLTRGGQGCLGVMSSGVEVSLRAPDVKAVDTIGAGDAFQAGLLSALADADALAPPALARLGEKGVRHALRRALDVAGLTCQRAGADLPTRAEYEAFVRQPAGGSGRAAAGASDAVAVAR